MLTGLNPFRAGCLQLADGQPVSSSQPWGSGDSHLAAIHLSNAAASHVVSRALPSHPGHPAWLEHTGNLRRSALARCPIGWAHIMKYLPGRPIEEPGSGGRGWYFYLFLEEGEQTKVVLASLALGQETGRRSSGQGKRLKALCPGIVHNPGRLLSDFSSRLFS